MRQTQTAQRDVILLLDIKKKIAYLKKKYCTSNPFELADALGILVIKEDLGSIEGYYNKQLRQKQIHINCNLSEKDIFTPQQMNAMRSLLVNRAKEMAAQNEIDINTRRVRPNGNFAIFDSTIVYTFNPYEIAHPRIGFIEIALEGKEEILSIK